MKKTTSLLSFVLSIFLASCGDNVANISEQELPNAIYGQIAALKNYSVNYEAMLAEMEQTISQSSGGKPQQGNAATGSVADLYMQFAVVGDKYGVALAEYKSLSDRLHTISAGLKDGSIVAADAAKEFPNIKKRLEDSAKVMEETKPKLDEIAAKYEQTKGTQ